jgi:hypothetical protein
VGTRRVVPVVIFLRGDPSERLLELGGDAETYLRFHFISVYSALDDNERQRYETEYPAEAKDVSTQPSACPPGRPPGG